MPTQGDCYRQPRAIGVGYTLEEREGVKVRVYTKRTKRDPRGAYQTAVFPSSGGQVICHGYGATADASRADAGLAS